MAPELVHASTYRAEAGEHAAPHSYRVWKIVAYTAGTIRTTIGEEEITATAGSILAVPPEVAHAERAETAYANSYLLVHAPAAWPWPSRLDSDPEIAGLVETIVGEYTRSEDFADELCAALLAELDVRLRRQRRMRSGADTIVSAAERLMRENIAEPLRIAEIADEVGVAVSTLRAYFAAERGCSPQARLLDLRLRLAETLLGASDLTVEVVALRAGFDSASHLRRHLRTHRGRTPSEVRAAAR